MADQNYGVYPNAQNVYANWSPQYYPGPGVAGFNPYQWQGWQSQLGGIEQQMPWANWASQQGMGLYNNANWALGQQMPGMDFIARNAGQGLGQYYQGLGQAQEGWGRAGGIADQGMGQMGAGYQQQLPALYRGAGQAQDALGMTPWGITGMLGASESLRGRADEALGSFYDRTASGDWGINPAMKSFVESVRSPISQAPGLNSAIENAQALTTDRFMADVMPGLRGGAAGAGGYGGSRHGITEAVAGSKLGDTLANLASDLTFKGYSEALNRGVQDRANTLDAMMSGNQMGLSAYNALPNLLGTSYNIASDPYARAVGAAPGYMSQIGQATGMGAAPGALGYGYGQDLMGAAPGLGTLYSQPGMLGMNAGQQLPGMYQQAGGMMGAPGQFMMSQLPGMYGMLGNTAGLGAAPGQLMGQWGGMMSGIGDRNQQLAQMMIQDEMNRWNYYQQLPMDMTQWYGGMMAGAGGLGSQQSRTNPNAMDPITGMIGGAMMGGSLWDQIFGAPGDGAQYV